MTDISPGILIRSYFTDYLVCQKGLSKTTIKTYRDAIRLFLRFLAKDTRKNLGKLCLHEFTAERVSRFLNDLEQQRHNHIRTRNQRLSALRVFFEYMALREPEMLLEAEQVSAIPSKRVGPPVTGYLERDQVETLFAALPRQGKFALRDRTLLLFLYNTGARVQEVANLKVENLDFDEPFRVHLHGKGNKWRVCPLWPDTASHLQRLLAEYGRKTQTDQPVFRSLHGDALTRYGIYKLVRRHTAGLSLATGSEVHHISPHSLRHTTAVHLLESGVEVNVIRAWLGHVSLETTNRYAELTLRMKAKALQQCQPPTNSTDKPRKGKLWHKDSDLLKWLESL